LERSKSVRPYSPDNRTSSLPSAIAGGSPPRLLDEVRGRIRRLGLSLRTEKTCVDWIRRFIVASGKRHPRDMGAIEIQSFLARRVIEEQVATSPRNQAWSARLRCPLSS
jgi:hypothetical protein